MNIITEIWYNWHQSTHAQTDYFGNNHYINGCDYQVAKVEADDCYEIKVNFEKREAVIYYIDDSTPHGLRTEIIYNINKIFSSFKK